MTEENKSTTFPINRWGVPVGDGEVYLNDLDFDFEDYFKRSAAGELSEDESGDHSARVYGMFCRDFFKSGGDSAAIQPWVANYIAKKLYEALRGEPWNNIMRLPWDEPTSDLTPKGQRAFETYAHVHNTLREQPDAKVTDLIAEAAKNSNVSFETARADYYAMKKGIVWKTGIPSEFLKNTP